MIQSVTEISPVAQKLYDLHAELDEFSMVPVLDGDPEQYESVYAAAPTVINHDLYFLVDHALLGASYIIMHPMTSYRSPEHELTQRAIRAAYNDRTPKFHKYHEDLCLGAELKVVHNLGLNLKGRGPSHDRAAAVLFDVDGNPFAYNKSVGQSTALAWREATLETTEGHKVIPAGMFFRIGYGRNGVNSVQEEMGGSGDYVVSLEKAPPPTDVKLLRFSAFLIDRELAECAYINATGPECYTEYKSSVQRALDTRLGDIAEQNLTLLRDGHASSVGSV